MSTSFSYHPSSYRDPSGFIFEKDNIVYRQVNTIFKEHFEFFINSGCYKKLVEEQLLIPHEEVAENLTGNAEWYTTLKPEKIQFISYPWEWSFDMLKDAALLTLRIAKEATESGMILKDATPYNIQWHCGQFIFIDSLSFEKYNPDEPWIAYRQFCEGFLAPLVLMHYSKHSLEPLLLAYPEGIPLAIAKALLPGRSKFSLHTYLHIHLHARVAQRKDNAEPVKAKFSRRKFQNLISSLEILIHKLRMPARSTTWSGYYEEAYLRNDYLKQKKAILRNWIDELSQIKSVADLGANDGEFSHLFSSKDIQTITADFDPYCINKLYNEIKTKKEKKIQPMVLDLSNPSPSIGINNEERSSFISRLNVDLVLALALIHHLAIGKNIPLERIAFFFSKTAPNLIIEFVPKEDEKVQILLSQKNDIYGAYDEKSFIEAFSRYFIIEKFQKIPGTGRVLYLMKRL